MAESSNERNRSRFFTGILCYFGAQFVMNRAFAFSAKIRAQSPRPAVFVTTAAVRSI